MSSNERCSKKPDLSPDARLTLCMLASGSRGNAIYISDQSTSLLIDSGLSGIEIERRMNSKGLSPEALTAILVTHEHSDHIQGVGVLARRFKLPVFMTEKTKTSARNLGKVDRLQFFECGRSFTINRFKIHPFSLSHDAKDPAGFTLEQNGSKIGVATDLGMATAMVKDHLKGCAALVLEANHDPDMLINGPYPWPLKQRIKSRTGHLSNLESRALLDELKHNRLSHVILAHLSETNNTPEKARRTVGPALENGPTRLHVALQDICGDVLDV